MLASYPVVSADYIAGLTKALQIAREIQNKLNDEYSLVVGDAIAEEIEKCYELNLQAERNRNR